MILRSRALHTGRNLSGFSLVEIVVVLGITAMMLGTAMFIMSTPNEERELREEHGKIEDLVRQGRALAVSYQQTFVLELSEGQAALRPLTMPGNESEFDYTGEESRVSGLKPLEDQKWPRVEELSLNYQLEVRRWGKLNFDPVIEKRTEQILLEAGGMFEPISVLLSKDERANSLSRVYHPLTGLAEDEELTISGSP